MINHVTGVMYHRPVNGYMIYTTYITNVIVYKTLCHIMIVLFGPFEHNIHFKVNHLAGFEHL